MKCLAQKKHQLRRKRAMRNRKSLRGTAVKPRLSVMKSNQHIQAQLIDDQTGVSLGGVSTYSKGFRGTEFGKRSKLAAAKLGEAIAELAAKKNVKEVVFDRGPFRYSGILAELANAAREKGLVF